MTATEIEKKGYRYLIDIDRDYLINALMEDIECRR